MPSFLTVMTRGLPCSTKVPMTLITVHTAPVATLSSLQVDSRVLSCVVAWVAAWSRWVTCPGRPYAAAVPGPPSCTVHLLSGKQCRGRDRVPTWKSAQPRILSPFCRGGIYSVRWVCPRLGVSSRMVEWLLLHNDEVGR